MKIRNLLLAMLTLPMCLVSLAQAQEAPQGAIKTGIQVHGDWLLEIYEPDGTFVESYAFQNSLTTPAVLAAAVKGDLVFGGIYVILRNAAGATQGQGPCSGDCEIAPSGLSTGSTPHSTNLQVTQMGTNYETLHLAGSVTATSTTNIDSVVTWTCQCGNTKTPQQCASAPDSCGVFTTKTLSSAVSVTSGQIIQVTVDITFQ